ISRTVSPEQNELLRQKLSREDVEHALCLSANSKAPGLNGIPYEVWKALDSRYKTAMSQNKPAFDCHIINVLLTVFNDIEIHSIVPGTGFA
ncbi:hypothetical protein C8F04DRAFT_875067, partial [Mycena alexandri]